MHPSPKKRRRDRDLDEANEVFVADPQHSRLIKLSTSLVFGGAFPLAHKYEAVAAGGGFVYTLDVTVGKYRVIKFTTAGVFQKEMTFPDGSGAEQLAEPNPNGAIHDQIAVDSGGTVYVTDADNQRVVELNGELKVLKPQLYGPTGYAQGIATGSVGGAIQVYVGDDNFSGTAFVRRYSPAGALLGTLTVPGAHGGLASDASGNVFDSEGFGGGGVLRIYTPPCPRSRRPRRAAWPARRWASRARARKRPSGARPTTAGISTAPTLSQPTPARRPPSAACSTCPAPTRSACAYRQQRSPSAEHRQLCRGCRRRLLLVAPTHTLTGNAVTFDASASAIPCYATVADYAWDFDGSGSYAVDGGGAPTISHTFTAPGTYQVQLRVTRAGGRVDAASGTILRRPTRPPGWWAYPSTVGTTPRNYRHVQISKNSPCGRARPPR